MAENLLELRNVTAYRGATRVFDGFSLVIAEGESTVILGPNGAGKTTLLKLVDREIYPVAGEGGSIRIMGSERWNIWELRSRFGILSNDLQHEYLGCAKGLNVVLSGFYSSIDTWRHQEFSPADIEKARSVMRRLGIDALADRPFGEMSTGQQRRFLLGRALVNDPCALLFDEPTAGLDLAASFHYMETIRRLVREGRTIVLVTHHLHEIPPEISRVVLLRDGRVFMEGGKERLLTSPVLSELFGIRLRVFKENGFYQVLPA
ncbi:molybdenum ABC transporter ATP-binding protein [Prosthecochloris sp. GSB1]|uniref:ABC transporter ATP-binding protein n=1 Tax=Prosthecochloris sp. GSB1 TaxID=281093 RepID=UPI000B8CBC91|nr:ATP-binding cassette domain-containing protein [Prosthecochloris sp. GSB1]ASQ90732.1 molybdenum ABC transporter ATP-binding protein [Prosthecochloris sp. GSB1]